MKGREIGAVDAATPTWYYATTRRPIVAVSTRIALYILQCPAAPADTGRAHARGFDRCDSSGPFCAGENVAGIHCCSLGVECFESRHQPWETLSE